MRKQFQNPDEYYHQHMKEAADRYMDGLHRAELKPNAKLTRAMGERAYHNASAGYRQHLDEAYHHNVQHIVHEHRLRDRQIKREGVRFGLKVFPFISLIFAFSAWLDFFYGDPGTWLICAIGAAFFLVLLVFAFINR